MLKKNIEWHFPNDIISAIDILNNMPKSVLHAGGTAILRIKSSSITDLVDLKNLNLNYIKQKDNIVHIGAMSTFDDLCKTNIDNSKTLNLLKNVVFKAASTPLRHRITVGGSIMDFPLWSDLMAGLFCLDAEIVFIDSNKTENVLSICEFIDKKYNKSRVLIKEVRFKDNNIVYATRRSSRVNFEYALFNIVAKGETLNDKISNLKVFIVGTNNHYQRLSEIESYFSDKDLTERDIEEACGSVNFSFNDNYIASSAYKSKIAKVFLKDCLKEMAGLKK